MSGRLTLKKDSDNVRLTFHKINSGRSPMRDKIRVAEPRRYSLWTANSSSDQWRHICHSGSWMMYTTPRRIGKNVVTQLGTNDNSKKRRKKSGFHYSRRRKCTVNKTTRKTDVKKKTRSEKHSSSNSKLLKTRRTIKIENKINGQTFKGQRSNVIWKPLRRCVQELFGGWPHGCLPHRVGQWNIRNRRSVANVTVFYNSHFTILLYSSPWQPRRDVDNLSTWHDYIVHCGITIESACMRGRNCKRALAP